MIGVKYIQSVLFIGYGLLRRCQHCGAKPTRQIILAQPDDSKMIPVYTCEKCFSHYIAQCIGGKYLQDNTSFVIHR